MTISSLLARWPDHRREHARTLRRVRWPRWSRIVEILGVYAYAIPACGIAFLRCVAILIMRRWAR